MARRPGTGMRWLLFGVSGRLSRRVYAWSLLFWIAVLAIPVSAVVRAVPDSSEMTMAGFAIIFSFVPAAWSIAVMSIKRLHDAGLPGILVGVLVVPAASFFMLLIIMLWPSAKGPNRHGPGPNQPGY
ncbi:DUF805 domain-containing protein [Hoeflea sp. YIM 152468]|uniref:DUF805 domain-containing protein n=1 Tax=Hoeflea sp. YIM 152468 TaxID=3031759 RepID=UPI0023DAA832|nr:DUF805 domain-containing protein [Hoeflea sp. YIM 152468]MDF1608293.1 DUF805 domain-containing protein [Hoeflea sp. YIM 152468]